MNASFLNALLEPVGRCVTPDDDARLCRPAIFARSITGEPATDQFIDTLVVAWSTDALTHPGSSTMARSATPSSARDQRPSALNGS
jgi:hypothetical protein